MKFSIEFTLKTPDKMPIEINQITVESVVAYTIELLNDWGFEVRLKNITRNP
jgi:hypothetical protein